MPELVATPSAQINLLTPSKIDIVDDGRGIAAALAKQLAARGYDAEVVDEIGDAPQVIDLRGLAPVESIDDALAVQRGAFQSARKLGPKAQTLVVVFDTAGSFGLGSEDAVATGPRAWIGGLAGLAKTANLEWDDATLKAVDIATDGVEIEVVARRIADELCAGGAEIEVAFDTDGRRWTVQTKSAEPLEEIGDSAIGAKDVIVASGGARGVTARCLIKLAQDCAPAIVLLGRTPLKEEPTFAAAATSDTELKRALIEEARSRGEAPNPKEIGEKAAAIAKQREIRATVDAIDAAGASVRYVAADVRDRQALQSALNEIRSDWGAPTGIVHAAGVLADKKIVDKSDDQFDFVFDTKVDGLRALLEVTADDPIEHLCIFSSVAARTGNVGQVDYSMANETLNKVARAEAASRGICATSLNWGPWDGGMVDDSLRAHFEAQGVSLIDLDGGAQLFRREFTAADSGSTEIVCGDGLPEATGELRAWISFDATSHPELSGHSIDGVAVVPVAYILDHFAGLARAARPQARLKRLGELKVLNGIRLSEFDDSTSISRFLAVASAKGESTVKLELRAADGALHYSATAEFGGELPDVEPLSATGEVKESRWDRDQIYGEILFHTDAFAAIDSVEGVGGEFARAAIGETSRRIAVDTGLQLALVQAVDADGRMNLPTGVEFFVDLGMDSQIDGLEIIVEQRKSSAHKAVFDVDYRDQRGELLAAIRGLEMHYFGDPLDVATGPS